MACGHNRRHWFSVHGQAYLRSPVCVRCGAKNPRPLTSAELDELESFNRAYPGYIGQHAVNGLREAGRDA